jgi:hypothetical protein
MKITEIEARLAEVLNRSKGSIPDEQLADMQDLNEHGEPGVALENFCTQLDEYDVAVPQELWNELRCLGEAMGLDESYWLTLAFISGKNANCTALSPSPTK